MRHNIILLLHKLCEGCVKIKRVSAWIFHEVQQVRMSLNLHTDKEQYDFTLLPWPIPSNSLPEYNQFSDILKWFSEGPDTFYHTAKTTPLHLHKSFIQKVIINICFGDSVHTAVLKK